jgi:hypothetical protein
MIRKTALILASALLLPSLAFAQGAAVQWGSSDKPAARQGIDGMKAFYEPAKVQQTGDVYAFTLYRSGTPSAGDELGRYMINCSTRELVTVVNGQPSAPTQLIAGEEIYPIGKKLCDWDQKSLFKKIFD